jgi:hypothetical protein
MSKGKKKYIYLLVCIVVFLSPSFLISQNAEVPEYIQTIANSDAQTAIEKLSNSLKTATTAAEKKDIYSLLATLQEQLGLYPEAQASYNSAAALVGIDKIDGQYLMLGAVRCALSCGDSASADFLLSTQIEQPLSVEISAKKKLYALWSWLTKSENHDDIQSIIPVLKTYAVEKDMISVQPVILLTLYELTNGKEWSDFLNTNYPNSAEAAIVSGKAQLLPAPFWYFVLAKSGQ